MTCIVGVEYGKKVLIGGDVQGTGWNNKVIHTQPKVFNRNGVVFGYTTSYRFGQLIELGLPDPIVPQNDSEIYRWLVCVLIPDMKAIFKEAGWEGGGSCLIGVRGQLWELQSDWSVLRSVKGYAAVGSGNEYAMGSMATSLNFGPLPETFEEYRAAVKRAISVAGTFSPSVGTEATVIST